MEQLDRDEIRNLCVAECVTLAREYHARPFGPGYYPYRDVVRTFLISQHRVPSEQPESSKMVVDFMVSAKKKIGRSLVYVDYVLGEVSVKNRDSRLAMDPMVFDPPGSLEEVWVKTIRHEEDTPVRYWASVDGSNLPEGTWRGRVTSAGLVEVDRAQYDELVRSYRTRHPELST